MLTTGPAAILATPAFATVFGLAAGVAFLAVAKAASRLLTPDDPVIGMAKVLVVNTAMMAAAVGGLALYFFFARPALAFFGIALVAGFLVAASVELFRFGGPATGAARRR